jgi:hypothetical protein
MQLKNKVMVIAGDGNRIGHTAALFFAKEGRRKSISCFLVIVFFASASLYSSQNINATKTSIPPVIEGKLTDECWQDNTSNQYPDRIEAKLPKKHSIGRMVVYPFEKTLKEYCVQAFVKDDWKDVDKISGNDKDVIIHQFWPVTTDRGGLFITVTNGLEAKVLEIEVCEK